MLWFLTMLIAGGPWVTPSLAESVHDRIGGPELCSRAKTRSVLRSVAARDLQRKSFNDPLALQTDVRHYRLELEVVPATSFIDGTTTMMVDCVEDGVESFHFWLHSALTINEVEIDGSGVVWRRLDAATLEVDLPSRCDGGEDFELVVDYEGHPVTSGLSSIVFETQGEWPIVSTLSEPWFAYTWWPVKEDSRDKATGELWITVPSDLTVAANGVLEGTTTLSGGRRRFEWSTDYPMSPYLFAFSATRYTTFGELFSYDDHSMPVEFFIWPDQDTPANRSGWLRSVDMLKTFSELYGLYPFVDEKYAIYQFPWGGGMEHQTATGQGGNSAFSEALTAHELGHQWWGDMVTCATWSDIWLNEGFATYSAALWFEYQSGSRDPAALRAYMSSARPDEFDEAIYIVNPTDVGRIFSGNYSYRKGAWVLHMLRGVVGTEIFFDILAAYRDRFEYSTATTDDFRGVAEEVWGQDLTWFFDQWVYGGGAPAYRYGWQEHEISGRRYLEIALEQTQDEGPFVMPVKVKIVEDGQPRRVTLWNTASTQHYLVPISSPVDTLDLDPEGWILTRSDFVAPFSDGPPKLVAVEPASGSVVPAGEPLSMTLTFHEDVVIDEADISLQRQGGATFEVDVAYDASNHRATLTTREPLAGGSYELKIRDTVVDAQGLAFDGEVGAPFSPSPLPSGDGLPGGDAVIRFGVLGTRDGSGRAQAE